MNLILLEPDEATDNSEQVTLRGARARHVKGVLKATPGQPLRIGVVNGPMGIGTVTEVDDHSVSLRCAFHETPPRPPIDLLLALPRPKVMRRLWAQLAALGVGHIILTNAARVERNYFDTHVLAPELYRPLLIEGLQQARDTHVPLVSVHRQFRVLVEDELDEITGDSARIVAEPGAAAPLRDVVRSRTQSRVLLAVGPEGGWNEFELSLLEAHGFTRASMGGRTLRTDTACIALFALTREALES